MSAHSTTPYLLAIGSNLLFGTASITFSRFSRSHSPTWVNQLKVTIGLAGFLIAFLVSESYTRLSLAGHGALLGSGLFGLFMGDYFLFRSFATLGPSRTLVLYSFQPFLLGLYGYLFLSQGFSGRQMVAIGCMILCVFAFVVERSRETGKHDLRSFAFAFVGICFDALGVMLSRQAYEETQDLGAFQANATRALGAIAGFLILSPTFMPDLARDLSGMNRKDRRQVLAACVFGTFLSLTLYLSALKSAHVASLTAISITSPVWVSLIEHARLRSWPSKELWCAFGLFLIGFWLMQTA
jgi:drug/metabolite transporter (DMT)-like permease